MYTTRHLGFKTGEQTAFKTVFLYILTFSVASTVDEREAAKK